MIVGYGFHVEYVDSELGWMSFSGDIYNRGQWRITDVSGDEIWFMRLKKHNGRYIAQELDGEDQHADQLPRVTEIANSDALARLIKKELRLTSRRYARAADRIKLQRKRSPARQRDASEGGEG